MAATGVISGKDGGITFAGGYDAKCSDWTLNITHDSIESTALGDNFRSFANGIYSWSGSFTTVVDTSDAAWSSAGGSNITDLGIGVAASAATFTFDADASGGTFTGSILITGASVNASIAANTPTTATFDFQGSGALTLTGAG